MPRRYRREVLDHLGLVAGMYDELGIGEALDRALQHPPETRLVTVGSAVKALVLNGRGLVPQHLSVGPLFFHNNPTQRRSAPGIEAQPLHDDPLGRAWDALDAPGVTERYRLMATRAVPRLGLTPPCVHLDRTSCHVDGRDHRDDEPEAHVMHLTRGDSREHRPDLNHVMRDFLGAHPAGIPVLMKPLRGHPRAARDFGQVVTEHMRQRQPTAETTYLGADRALDSAEHLRQLAVTGTTGMTRVPAPRTDAQPVLEPATPAAMAPRRAGYRDQAHTVPSGSVPQRWVLIASAHRHPQAQRPVDQHGLQQRGAEGKACQQLCHTALACAAEAQQALATFTHGLSPTTLHACHLRPTPRSHRRGRPGQGAQPDPVVDQIEGGLASSIAARHSLVAQHRCVILATNARDDQV